MVLMVVVWLFFGGGDTVPPEIYTFWTLQATPSSLPTRTPPTHTPAWKPFTGRRPKICCTRATNHNGNVHGTCFPLRVLLFTLDTRSAQQTCPQVWLLLLDCGVQLCCGGADALLVAPVLPMPRHLRGLEYLAFVLCKYTRKASESTYTAKTYTKP